MITPPPPSPSPFLNDLAQEHRDWLRAFEPQYGRNWEKLLNADFEAGIVEAGVRRFLVSCGIEVKPNEDLTGRSQRADFRCLISDCKFYVEVTCISIEKATEITGLCNGDNPASRPTPLNRHVMRTCQGKAKQCSDHDAPVLLAIGTLHANATMFSFGPPYDEMVLTGWTETTVILDRKVLEFESSINRETELADSAFLKFDPNEEIGFARNSISGLLLCGVSLMPMWVTGLLHPNPARPFDPKLLPGVSFGQVEVDSSSRQLRVHWSQAGGG